VISPPSLSRLDVEGPRDAGRRRLSGALSVSLLAHLFLAVLLGVVAHRISTTNIGQTEIRKPPIARMAWSGFGGGGSGDHQAPPRQLERPGQQRTPAIAAPASAITPTSAPKPADDVQPVVAPIMPVESGLQISPGVSAAITQTSDFLGPGSGGGPGSGKGPGNGNGDGAGLNDGSGEGTGGGRPGDIAPVLLKQVRPNYTQAGMMARAQGIMRVEAVVLTDGSVGDVRLVGGFEPPFGLDQEAVNAVKQWRFVPGRREGHVTPMRVSIELSFTLR